jgi:hypothetical protein
MKALRCQMRRMTSISPPMLDRPGEHHAQRVIVGRGVCGHGSHPMMEVSQEGDGVDRGALCEESRNREKEADVHAASSILRSGNPLLQERFSP